MPISNPSPERLSIPGYELIRTIGEGAFGQVWLAQGVTGAFRAVKIVRRNDLENQGGFEQEFAGLKAFTALSVREPRQLALLHVGRNDSEGFFFYVMELADDLRLGREIDPANYVPCTLQAMLQQRARLQPSVVIRLALGLAEALASMHSANLVHRDIKLANVILVGGVPKLADIGLVREVRKGQTNVGTAGYIPPEGPGMPTADVFAFGKLLYELGTGLDRNEYPRIPDLPGGHSDINGLQELETVWTKACNPVPNQRHANGQELYEEIALLQAQKSVKHLRAVESRVRKLRRMGVVSILLAALLIGAGTLTVLVYQQREQLRLATYAALIGKATLHILAKNYGAALDTLQTHSKLDSTDVGFEFCALQNEARHFTSLIISDSKQNFGILPVDHLEFSPDSEELAELRGTNAILWKFGSAQGTQSSFAAEESAYVTAVSDFAWDRFNHRLYCQGTYPTNWETVSQVYQYEIGSTFGLALPAKEAMRIQGTRDPAGLRISRRDHGEWIANSNQFLKLSNNSTNEYFWSFAVDESGDHVVSRLIGGRNHNARFAVVVSSLKEHQILWRLESSNLVHSVTISPDGKWVAVGINQSSNLSVYNASSGEPIWVQTAHAGQLRAIQFSPDSRWIATGADDGRVKLWNTTNGVLRDEMPGPAGSIRSLAWDPSIRRLAAGTSEGKVIIWPLDSQALPHRPTLVRNGYWMQDGGGLLLSPNGAWLAASSSTGTLMLNSITNLEERTEITGAFAPLFFAPASPELIARSMNGELVYCQMNPLRTDHSGVWLISPNKSSAIDVSSLATHPKAGLFFCATDGAISYLDFSRVDWKQLRDGGSLSNQISIRWSHPGTSRPNETRPGFVSINPEGTQVMCGYRKSGIVEIYDAGSGAILSQWRHRSGVFATLLGPEGKWCAVGDEEDHVVVYSLHGDKAYLEAELKVEGMPYSLTYNSRSHRLLCGTTIGAVQFFRSDTWTPLTVFRVNDPTRSTGDMAVADLRFTADQLWLAARTSAGTVQVWDGRPDRFQSTPSY